MEWILFYPELAINQVMEPTSDFTVCVTELKGHYGVLVYACIMTLQLGNPSVRSKQIKCTTVHKVQQMPKPAQLQSNQSRLC